MDLEERFEEALAYLDEGNHRSAKEILLQLDSLNTGIIGVKMNLSLIYQREGNNEKAIQLLEEAYQSDPTHPAVARQLAELTGSQSHGHHAEELRTRVIQVSSEQFHHDFQHRSPRVNDEYARFDVELTGSVVNIETAGRVVILKGTDKAVGQGVVCKFSEEQFTAVTEAELKVGDTTRIIGNSFGIGPDMTEVLLFNCRLTGISQ